jgi:hypothetical protein
LVQVLRPSSQQASSFSQVCGVAAKTKKKKKTRENKGWLRGREAA